MASGSSEPHGLRSAQTGSGRDTPRRIGGSHATNTRNQPCNIKAEPAESSESSQPFPPLDEADSESQEELDLYENPENVVGVSISRAQTRIRSPNTPEAEKKCSIEEFGGGNHALAPDSGGVRREKTEEGGSVGQQRTVAQTHEEEKRHLIPDAAGRDMSHNFKRSSREGSKPSATEQRPDSNDRAGSSRKRSRTWAFPGKNYAPNFNLKKYLPHWPSISLPKTPNFSLATSLHHGRLGGKAGGEEKAERPDTMLSKVEEGTEPRQRAYQQYTVGRRRSAADRLVPDSHSIKRSDVGTLATDHRQQKRPSLRRSTSENSSLFTNRVLTRTSSPEWYDIPEHANNRFQAIMDSFRDSTSRLSSMPSINIAALRREVNFSFSNGSLADEATRNITRDTPEERVEAKHRARYLRHHHPHHPSSSSPRVIEWEDNTERQFPHLFHAMKELKGDVVVMGGYRSSVLRSATPPQRQLWIPLKVGFNIRKVNLAVGLNPEDEENMEEHVIPSGTLSHIGPVDICRRLMRKLRKCDNSRKGELRVWDYGYDWRLSPHLLSRKLIEFVQDLPCNQPDTPPEKRGAVIIAHSLGGIVVRHAVNQRPELFSGVVYAGTPQHCVNILGPLRNGDDVLFSSDVLSAQVNFSFRTSYVLLPLDGGCFINKHTGERYPLDFFNVDTWKEYRLTPCLNPPLPPLSSNNSSRISNILSGNKQSPSLPSPEHSPDRQTEPQEQAEKKRMSGTNSKSSPSPSSSPSTSPTRPIPQDIGDKATNAAPRQSAVGPSFGRRRAQTTTAIQDDTTPDDGATPTAPSHDEAYNYLSRTLADTKKFKHELAFNPSHHAHNVYPPVAVLYGKSVPTVYGAKVASQEDIKRSDAFDELVFAAGDGVVLARAAMAPDGYKVVKDGLVLSDRGHVGLLGDLEGVGKCLNAVVRGRNEGIGLGLKEHGSEAAAEGSS